MATKLETLLSYTAAHKRDSWVTLGSAVIPAINRVFLKDTLFRLNAPGTPLHNHFLFVLQDFTEVIDWLAYSEDLTSTEGFITTVDGVYHPYLRVFLTDVDYAAIVDPYDDTFIPFETSTSDVVIISDDDYVRILKDIGMPFIKDEELEFTREEILKFGVYPAMMEYFKWYPIIEVETFPMNSPSFSIPIPPDAFTAVRAYVDNGYPVGAIGNPLNRYFDELLVSGPQGIYPVSSSYANRRKGYFDVGSYSTYVMERAVRQGMMNYSTRTRIRVRVQAGHVVGYSTKRGVLEIEWGKMSNNWTDIPFTRQREVRDLASAYILRMFGMLRSQARADDIQGTVDYQLFKEEADKLEEKIITLWQDSTKGVVIRG